MPPAVSLLRTALFSVALLQAAITDAAAVRVDHLRIELVSESSTLVPGRTTWLGLRLQHDPHWHTYWINPGDSGLPTRLNWQLPERYTADPIDWPAPSRFKVGGLYNFGYDGDVLLPVALHVPDSATPGARVNLAVEAKWLICEEECIPGQAGLQLQLPVARDVVVSPAAALFAQARASTPTAIHWNGDARIDAGKIDIRLSGSGLPAIEGLDVFAVQRRLLDNAPPTLRREGDTLHIQARQNDYFIAAPAELELVLTSTVTNGAPASWRVRVPFPEHGASDSPAAVSQP